MGLTTDITTSNILIFPKYILNTKPQPCLPGAKEREKLTMSIVKSVFEAIKRDKSYLIGAILTVGILLLLMSQHNWQSRPLSGDSEPFKSDLPNFAAINDVKQKKQQFIDYLRPLIEKENGKIQYKKAHLERLISELESRSYHSAITRKKLYKLANEYGIEKEQLESNLDELSSRIDIIPVSLVLAQAANESAWGTSRFASKGNNLFGQRCYDKGCGFVAKKHRPNGHYEMRKYDSIQASISSHMRHLNSHKTYKRLRDIRAGLRRRGQLITGEKLAHGLSSYSERGQAYVKELISTIQNNGLE